MKHTIELNGKHYNALTGDLIGHEHELNAPVVVHTPAAAHHAKTVPPTTSHPKRKAVHTASRHKGGRSRTLMRAGLEKPAMKPVLHSTPKAANKIRTIAQLHSDAARLARASKIQQSKLVSRFGSLAGQSTYSHQQ